MVTVLDCPLWPGTVTTIWTGRFCPSTQSWYGIMVTPCRRSACRPERTAGSRSMVNSLAVSTSMA